MLLGIFLNLSIPVLRYYDEVFLLGHRSRKIAVLVWSRKCWAHFSKLLDQRFTNSCSPRRRSQSEEFSRRPFPLLKIFSMFYFSSPRCIFWSEKLCGAPFSSPTSKKVKQIFSSFHFPSPRRIFRSEKFLQRPFPLVPSKEINKFFQVFIFYC